VSVASCNVRERGELSGIVRITFIVNKMWYMARSLLLFRAMTTPLLANVASRYLEPITHPWTVLGGGLFAGGVAGGGVFGDGLQLAWRLLHLLLLL
jgi:hypothetical protein